MFSDIN